MNIKTQKIRKIKKIECDEPHEIFDNKTSDTVKKMNKIMCNPKKEYLNFNLNCIYIFIKFNLSI